MFSLSSARRRHRGKIMFSGITGTLRENLKATCDGEYTKHNGEYTKHNQRL